MVRRFYKKVINRGPTSIAAGKIDDPIATGKDSTTAGQVTVTDVDVPTGAKLTKVDIQYTFANLVAVAGVVWFTIQIIRGGQTTTVGPRVVGGNNQRNQVFFQLQRSCGFNQNVTIHKVFKIPKMLRRLREGDNWSVTWEGNVALTRAATVIYKFEM